MESTAFLFPGGGTQYIGMGKEWYDNYTVVRELFEEANDLLGYNLKKICFEGDLNVLSNMNHAQPAVFVVSVAAYHVFRAEADIVPAMAAGHSLGEYAALHTAGVLSLHDSLRLIRKRGALLHEAGATQDATMMAVSKLDKEVVEDACAKINHSGGHVYVAVYNSPQQHVVSGMRKDIIKLETQLEAMGADVTILNIMTPSHCALMQHAADVFEEELSHYSWGKFSFPVISNVTGKPYTAADNLSEMLVNHMTSPVKWVNIIRYMETSGIRNLIELGPQAILKNLTPYISSGMKAYAWDIAEDVIAAGKQLKDHGAYIRRCMAIAVSTKNYNDDMEEYGENVVKPFRELEEMAAQEIMLPEYPDKALYLLETILDYKKVPDKEKIKRLERI